jgi:hypothetical protein
MKPSYQIPPGMTPEDARKHLFERSVPWKVPEGKPANGPCRVLPSSIRGHDVLHNDYPSISLGKRTTVKGNTLAAYAYEGRRPDPGEYAIHDCDCKDCVQTDGHVRWGSAAENAQAAVARGLCDGPRRKRDVAGEKNPRAKLSSQQVGEMRWLAKNLDCWFGPEIANHHHLNVALAILYGVTKTQIRTILLGGEWKNISPSRPECLPTVADIPPDAKPIPIYSEKVSVDQARRILESYWSTPQAERFGLSGKIADDMGLADHMVKAVLQRKIHETVLPEHPAADLRGDRVKPVDASVVQAIRATVKRWDVDGRRPVCWKAALRKKSGVTHDQLERILDRRSFDDVPDDPLRAWADDELEFVAANGRGMAHPMAKLSGAEIFEILDRTLIRNEKHCHVAPDYGVTGALVGMIVKGKIWKDDLARWRKVRGIQ